MIDRKHCLGCRQDFYNGNNPYGIQVCWHREGAKFDQYRLVPTDLRPPYLGLPVVSLPICYDKARHVKVKLGVLDEREYWRSSW